MSVTEGPPKEESESLQFADRLLHTPPEDRQLDEINSFLEMFSLKEVNFENIQLAVKNKHYASDIRELHRLVAHHMQFVQYQCPHRELKHKDSCKFQCSIILEGSVKVFDWRDREETKELLYLQTGDIILDKHILKTLQRPIMFVYAENTSVGVAKYEDFQETLFSSVEEKEDQKIISSFRLFQSLPLFSFENLCQQFTLKNCVKGESIFEINDPVKAIYIIKNGEFIMEEEVTFKQGIKSNVNGSVDDETPRNQSASEDIMELSVQLNARKKKESRKSMGTRVLLAGELFGEDDVIEEFCSREDNEGINQEISKKTFSPQAYRKCSVKCFSIKAQLLILPSNELIHRVLEKVKPGVLKKLQDISLKKKAIYAKSVNKIRKSVLPYTNYLLPQTPNSSTPSNSPRLTASNFTIQSQFISNKLRRYQKVKKQNSKSLNHSTSNQNSQSSKSPSQLQKQQQQLLKQCSPSECIDEKMNCNQSIVPTAPAASHFKKIQEDNLKLQKIAFNSAHSIPLILQISSPLSSNTVHFNLPSPIQQESPTTSLALLPVCDEIESDQQINFNKNDKSTLEIPDNKSLTLHALQSDDLMNKININHLEDSHQQRPARRTKSFSHFELTSSTLQPTLNKDSVLFRKQFERTESQSQSKASIPEIPYEDASFASLKKPSSTKIILQFQRSSSKLSSKKPSSSLNSSTIWQSKNASAIGSAVEYGSILGSCSAITIAPSPLALNNSSKINFDSNRIMSARKLMSNEPSQFIKYVPLAEAAKKKVVFQDDKLKQQINQKNLLQKSQDPTKQKHPYTIQQSQSRENINSQKVPETTVTYAGLGSKLEKEVGDRSMKIKLLTPIFSRGYKENFIKEMANLNRRNRKPNYIPEFKQDNSRRLDQQNKLIHSLLKNNTKSALFSSNSNNNSNTSNNIFSIPNHLNMKAIINNSNQLQISQQVNQPFPQHNPTLLISSVPQTPEVNPAQEQVIPEILLFSHSLLNNSFQRKAASSLPSSPIRISSPSSPLKTSHVQLPTKIQLPQSSSQPSSPQSKQYPSYYLVNGTQPSKQQGQQLQQQLTQKTQFPFSTDAVQQFLPSSRGNTAKEHTPQNNPSPCYHYYSRGFQGSKKTFSSFETSNITNNNSPQYRNSLQTTDRNSQVLKRRSCEPVERQQQKLESGGQQQFSQYKQVSQKSQPVSPFFRKRPPPLQMMEITTAVQAC